MKKDINKSDEEAAGLGGLGVAATGNRQTPLDPGSSGAADASPLSGVTANHGDDKGQTGTSAAHGSVVSQSGIPPQAVGHQKEAAGLGGVRPAATKGNHRPLDSRFRGNDNGGGDVMESQHGPSRENVHRMFDRIAPRYDLLNHLLSFNRDKVWRRRMGTMLPVRPDLKLLDLATGTGDQLLALYDSGKIASGVGIDPAEKMLAIGRDKIARRSLSDKLSLAVGAGESIPCADKTFDVVTISFGIRNVTDVPKALREMHRVLKPDGRALILEFSLPQSRLIRAGYLFYFRHILPTLGGWISGDREAYRYLNKTVESFPYGDQFTKLMREAGFENVKATPLTFGVASIYQGDKR